MWVVSTTYSWICGGTEIISYQTSIRVAVPRGCRINAIVDNMWVLAHHSIYSPSYLLTPLGGLGPEPRLVLIKPQSLVSCELLAWLSWLSPSGLEGRLFRHFILILFHSTLHMFPSESSSHCFLMLTSLTALQNCSLAILFYSLQHCQPLLRICYVPVLT